MLITQKFFDQCNPSYQAVITQLELDLSSTDDNHLQEKYLDDFSSKYLMPKEYWELKLELSNFLWSISEEKCSSFVLKGIYQFYYNRKSEVYISDGFYRKILDLSMKKFSLMMPSRCRDYIKNALTYPHKNLEKFYQKYEEYATSQPSSALIKQYNKMKELYTRIKAAENDVSKWFSLLFEAKDENFIIHNIEYRLGGNLLDKKLWKIYISYLKDEKKYFELLHVYSKYCRFFLDDDKMKAEYEAEVMKYGKEFAVPWTETFIFEACESWGDVYEREEESNPNSAFSSPSLPVIGQVGNFYDNILPQEFSFPKPLIRYLLDVSSHILLRKFHRCCKYFFLRKPTPICYRIEIPSKEIIFDNEVLSLNPSDTVAPVNNYYITTSIIAQRYPEEDNPLFLPSLIPLLSRCDAKYLKFGQQKLTFNELKIFIESGNVEILEIDELIDVKGETMLPLEGIIKFMPKIRHFEMYSIKCTLNTAEFLTNFNFYNKIKIFNLYKAYGTPLNIQQFKDFCIKNMATSFRISITFQEDVVTEEYIKNFKEAMKDQKYFSQKCINQLQIERGEWN